MTPGIETWLTHIWLSKGWRSTALLPLAWVYTALVQCRRMLYRIGLLRSESVNATVIVVGNIVAGGGGKTPLTMAIVAHLKQSGYLVGIVSRGYGRSHQYVREVEPQSSSQEVGDEPLMMKRRCHVPVFVARRRAEAAKALLAAYPATQIVVCDDGLQHYALARDIEICAMDDRGVGNGRLLPAGPLREPWPRAVDLLIHTSQRSMTLGYGSSRALASEAVDASGAVKPLQQFKAQAVNAVAAIAQPHLFFDMLQAQGLRLDETFALPDHANFEDWTPPSGNTPLLCTEKDAVKLWPRHPHVWAVPLEFTPEAAFWTALEALIQGRQKL
jgi:tetraacyldisaccharide 4'-kinase